MVLATAPEIIKSISTSYTTLAAFYDQIGPSTVELATTRGQYGLKSLTWQTLLKVSYTAVFIGQEF